MRVHLRRTWADRLQFGIRRHSIGGFNIDLGRLSLCIRTYPANRPTKFFDFELGKKSETN